MVCANEVFETRVMCMCSCRDFEVNFFGSPKVYFPIWINFHIFLAIHISCIQSQNLSVVHVNEFLMISTTHVDNFKLFGDKKNSKFFHMCKKVVFVELVLASFQYQLLG
jgi:hypothetical protein